jgi:3-hydroxyacyl-CoA dehydrogenase / enoyl-CoA hydratase / 3-hydroxybutyryl-CoA epimerase
MKTLHMEKSDDGIVVVHLNEEEDRVNKLSSTMMAELDEILKEVENDQSIQGMIFISDKEDNFVVGADVKEFSKITLPGVAKELVHRVHALFDRIENLPFPVLAAIHGPCLGGGLELALACHYRIATDHPRTSLGLPEVRLGLIPAGGGTQRLTRLLGVKKALPLMIQGRTLSAPRAKALGLVDLTVYPFNLLDTAKKCLSHFKRPKRAKCAKFPSFDWAICHLSPVRNLFFNLASRKVEKKTQGNYPALPRLIECVNTGLANGIPDGLAAEAEYFDTLMLSPESRALRHIFFATTALKKNPLAGEAKTIGHMGVLGSGLMGSGIATVSAKGGIPVTLKDVSWDRLAGGLKGIWNEFDRRRKSHRQTVVERDRAYSLITPAIDYSQFHRMEMVIEAVFEDLSLKHQVLRDVEEHTGPECIFASNTSAIPISRIAAASKRPETVIGMHYFSPVPRMPLLEVVVTPQTADWVTATAIDVGQRQGKTVIVVRDGPGFYTSRILSTFLHEAVALLEEAADIQQIDRAMLQFGFPVGPFKLLDEVGIDVATHVSRDLHPFLAPRGFSPPTKLENMLATGAKGRKSGRGFYRYSNKGLRQKIRIPGMNRPVSGEVYSHFGGSRRKVLDTSEIQERLSLIMANEAVLCLQENIIQNPRDGDVGAVMGLGFPPFLGGPFQYLDRLGVAEAVIRLERLADKVGERFQPAPLLTEMAIKGESFYA